MVQWYYRIMGQEFGPISSSELVQLRQRGEIDPFTHVRKGPDGEWVAAARVQGLFADDESPPRVIPVDETPASEDRTSPPKPSRVAPPPVDRQFGATLPPEIPAKSVVPSQSPTEGEYQDHRSEKPVIGSNLPYDTVANELMRVDLLVAASTCIDGVVQAPALNVPYGLLNVYVASIDREAILPIIHKLDYVNAYELWQIVIHTDDVELYVRYIPATGLKRFAARVLPKLEFALLDRSSSQLAEYRFGSDRIQEEIGKLLENVANASPTPKSAARSPPANSPLELNARRPATMTIAEAEHIVDIVSAALQEKPIHSLHPLSALEGYDVFQIDTAVKLRVANLFLFATQFENCDERFAETIRIHEGAICHIPLLFVADDKLAELQQLEPTSPEFRERKLDLLSFRFVDDEHFNNMETVSSFGDYCRSVGAKDPLYWQKVYTRLGLEYNSASPRGNDVEFPERTPTDF